MSVRLWIGKDRGLNVFASTASRLTAWIPWDNFSLSIFSIKLSGAVYEWNRTGCSSVEEGVP